MGAGPNTFISPPTTSLTNPSCMIPYQSNHLRYSSLPSCKSPPSPTHPCIPHTPSNSYSSAPAALQQCLHQRAVIVPITFTVRGQSPAYQAPGPTDHGIPVSARTASTLCVRTANGHHYIKRNHRDGPPRAGCNDDLTNTPQLPKYITLIALLILPHLTLLSPRTPATTPFGRLPLLSKRHTSLRSAQGCAL